MRRSIFLLFLYLSLSSPLQAAESPRNYTFAELVQKERAAVVSIRSAKLSKEGGGRLEIFSPFRVIDSNQRFGRGVWGPVSLSILPV
ncbi:MAG: hypothetical protein MPW15_28495 [Candidatus Manganitrophus sp.]|nr:hypothetical protein [Candidatus Manganitrophus sp.]